MRCGARRHLLALVTLLVIGVVNASAHDEHLVARQSSAGPPASQVSNPPANQETGRPPVVSDTTPNPPVVSDTPEVSQAPSNPPSISNPLPVTPSTPVNQPSASQPEAPPSQSTPPPTVPESQAPAAPSVTSTIVQSDGAVVVVTVPASSPTTSAPPAASSAGANDKDKEEPSKGLGPGSIIGLSIAGGVALLGIIGFFVWKFTRKRFTDYDDNEAIKWPELNSHAPGEEGGTTHALPVNNTGRAGFGDDDGYDSRAPSVAGNYSTTDFSHDPYAVPVNPHMNPNVPGPYRDDPAQYGANAYDPYRGPVPNSIHGQEEFQMTQMRTASPGPMRAMSPGPNRVLTPNPGPYAGAYGGPDRTMTMSPAGYDVGPPQGGYAPR